MLFACRHPSYWCYTVIFVLFWLFCFFFLGGGGAWARHKRQLVDALFFWNFVNIIVCLWIKLFKKNYVGWKNNWLEPRAWVLQEQCWKRMSHPVLEQSNSATSSLRRLRRMRVPSFLGDIRLVRSVVCTMLGFTTRTLKDNALPDTVQRLLFGKAVFQSGRCRS